MLKEWLTSDEFPGTRVLCGVFDGPELLDLQMQGIRGKIVYECLKEVVLDWEHLPLIGGTTFSEKYDPPMIRRMLPAAAVWLVTEVARRSNISEDERKN